jgi:hypothetical protein
MPTAMIALVGGQPLPNLLPVKHYHPDALVLLYTETTETVYNRLCQTVRATTRVHPLKVDPYDIVAIETELHKCLDASFVSGYRLLFNLTGGTKAMALAAYRVAEQRQAEVLYLESERGQSLAYRYDWSNGTLHVGQKETLPACLTLSDMLNAHLGPGMWQEHGASRQEGSLFEEAIAAVLRPHVDEVMVGVKTLDAQIDIDLVVRRGNQFGAIEAKTGKSAGTLEGLKQLNTNSAQLGIYTARFYVINTEPNHLHTEIMGAFNIQVIALRSYNRDTHSLSDQDRERLVEDVLRRLRAAESPAQDGTPVASRK